MAKITKRIVDASHVQEGQRYFVWDEQIKGFGLLVLPTGVKSYVFQYRTAEGRNRRATIGKHGSLTPEEARRKADDYRRAVKDGRDPLAEKNERRKALTVGEVLEAYLASDAFRLKAVGTQATDRGRIVRHLQPLLGAAHVDTLRPSDVLKAYAAIAEGKTATREKMGPRALARVRGGKGAARKSVLLLRAMLEWARLEGMIAHNPISEIKVDPDGTRDVILQDASEYGRLFATLDKMEAEKRLRPSVADAIRIIALTGARRGEVTGMKWQYVDLRAGLVTLPWSGHKTGRKTKKPRLIGLPTVAQAIIARQPDGAADDYVFRPLKGDGPVELSKPWEKIRKEAELPAGFGLHGLRHSLASHMAMGGAQGFEIMKVLGHRNITTSERYVTWANNREQGIAEKAAAVVLAGMSMPGAKDGSVDNVKPLKGGAQ